MLSLIIPTYNERENISYLIQQLSVLFTKHHIPAEMIIVDDNSPDGTAALVREWQELQEREPQIRVLTRSHKQGLASAVVEGMRLATGEIIGVMDADFSHSPEAIIQLYTAMHTSPFPDFVIGSRYVMGGRIVNWPWHRRLISRIATWSASFVTDVHDPLSGIFLIRQESVQNILSTPLAQRGFKICLELLVNAPWKRVQEVPITFTDRKHGTSKLSFQEYYYYICNLIRYLKHKKIR